MERRIKAMREQKPILITSHSVLGYPSWEFNETAIAEMVEAGVEIIELQFPFSEPVADGPTLAFANQAATNSGVTTDQCFEFANKICKRFPDTCFVIMTYYNVAYKRGISQFVHEAAQAGIDGIILPDLPPEESGEYVAECDKQGVSPIFLVTPKTAEARVDKVIELSKGMLYCVARLGVTGKQTLFTEEFHSYLARIRAKTNMAIGVGFGVQTADDVAGLTGTADIAIVCSQAIKIGMEKGSKAAADMLQGLRP
jgi:tryptophan synthase alpha chain